MNPLLVSLGRALAWGDNATYWNAFRRQLSSLGEGMATASVIAPHPLPKTVEYVRKHPELRQELRRLTRDKAYDIPDDFSVVSLSTAALAAERSAAAVRATTDAVRAGAPALAARALRNIETYTARSLVDLRAAVDTLGGPVHVPSSSSSSIACPAWEAKRTDNTVICSDAEITVLYKASLDVLRYIEAGNDIRARHDDFVDGIDNWVLTARSAAMALDPKTIARLLIGRKTQFKVDFPLAAVRADNSELLVGVPGLRINGVVLEKAGLHDIELPSPLTHDQCAAGLEHLSRAQIATIAALIRFSPYLQAFYLEHSEHMEDNVKYQPIVKVIAHCEQCLSQDFVCTRPCCKKA